MTTIHFLGEVPSGLTEEMFRHFRAMEFIDPQVNIMRIIGGSLKGRA